MGQYTLNKYMSRLMAVLLAVMLVFACVPAVHAEGESGSCGGSLSWSLSAGTLSISGSGAMTDFPESTMAPWYHLREEIVRLVLPEGLTSVGDLAFYGCENLTAVAIPGSVTRIGAYAFAGCTGMELLNLGSGVTSIGECAFSDCVSLAALRLPGSLQSIGMKAFYRCESITAVTVPSGVSSIGISAFAYCKSLVTADVQARISTIPEWLFYGCERLVSVTLPDTAEKISEFAFRGCDQLSTVYYDGSSRSAEEIQEIIGADVPGFDDTGYVSDSESSDTVSSGSAQVNDDGTITQENTTVTEGDHSTVSTTVTNTYPNDSTDAGYGLDITVAVDDDQGWEEARDLVEDALKNFNDTVTAGGGEAGNAQVNVYVNGTDTIDREFVDSLAGRDVKVTVLTENGSSWRMDGARLDSESSSDEYDLSYTLTAGSPELCQELETASSFLLRFHAPAQVNAEVLIRLGDAWALQNATLFQRDGGELLRFQTVVVDGEGYAHFYLASVNETTDYYIAMNLPDAGDEAIVPDELLPDYGNPVRHTPIEYEITGRTSSWGMTFGQVTWIMVGVLLACVVVVGFVMFSLNKRKLQRGYVPDLDEEYAG